MPNTTRKNHGGMEFHAALPEWKAHGNDPRDARAEPLVVSWEIDDSLQAVTKTFYPPFGRVFREEDFSRAYAAFSERYKGVEGSRGKS